MPTIIKPEFVAHGTEKCPIYSVHVSPDGKRLATAGNGKSSLAPLAPLFLMHDCIPGIGLGFFLRRDGFVFGLAIAYSQGSCSSKKQIAEYAFGA
jgi:hypothetical protein